MANLSGFNAEEVEPQGSLDPIPAGWYTAIITDSEMKETKSLTGEYLQLRLDVVEGDHEGRVVFDRLNLKNSNRTAVEIAQRQLSAICRAVGVMQPQDSSDLHDRPLRVKVSIRPARDGYDASNEVKAYSALEADENAAAPPPGKQPEAKPNAPVKKPWE